MPKRWMSTAKLRALARSGLTYDEIAEANERSEGWRPTRSTVKYKLDRMGFPPRYERHTDLIPWRVSMEHTNDRLRYMLRAESKSRTGAELTATDRKLVSMLHDLLFGRGQFLVVGYHDDVGFYLTERDDEDQDIIRQPKPRTVPTSEQLSTYDIREIARRDTG